MENKSLFDQYPDASEPIDYESIVSPPPSEGSCCTVFEKTLEIPACEFMESKDIDLKLDCLGRFLKVNIKLQNVCPNKFVTLGVLVYENNKLVTFKVREVFTGGRPGERCRDLDIGSFCFVFKENNPCCPRSFNIKIVANYTSVS